MESLSRTVSTNRLKTGLLKRALKQLPKYDVKFDKEADIFILFLIPTEAETIVHYIDEHVGLLFEARSKEIVGLQIEGFVKGFVPKHPNVAKVWKLSEALPQGEDVKDIGDLIFKVEQLKPKMAQEVIRASEPILTQESQRFAAAFAQ